MEMASFLNGQNNNTSVLNNVQPTPTNANLHQEQSVEQPLWITWSQPPLFWYLKNYLDVTDYDFA